MGDAGSTVLGFILAWFLVHLSQGQEAVMTPMTAVWLLALPLMDTVAVTIRRGDGFGDGETEYRQPCLIPGGARKVAGKQGASSPQQAEACFFKKKVNVFLSSWRILYTKERLSCQRW